MRKIQAFLFILLLIVGVGLQACDEQAVIDTGYKAYGTAVIFNNLVTDIGQSAFDSGTIDKDQADKITKLLLPFQDTLDLTEEALKTAVSTKEATAIEKVSTYLTTLASMQTEILDLCSSFGLNIQADLITQE